MPITFPTLDSKIKAEDLHDRNEIIQQFTNLGIHNNTHLSDSPNLGTKHVYKPDLGACLKSKRVASRELNPERVVFSCKIVKAKIELDDQAQYGKRILKVLDE